LEPPVRQQVVEPGVVVEEVLELVAVGRLQYLEEPEVAVELQQVEGVQQRVAEQFGELQQY
jgi:hypothetical protein|tara:strand:- start:320 stop:502 length:183 start_codon:yes stop_codon:yes gene_type:complete